MNKDVLWRCVALTILARFAIGSSSSATAEVSKNINGERKSKGKEYAERKSEKVVISLTELTGNNRIDKIEENTMQCCRGKKMYRKCSYKNRWQITINLFRLISYVDCLKEAWALLSWGCQNTFRRRSGMSQGPESFSLLPWSLSWNGRSWQTNVVSKT